MRPFEPLTWEELPESAKTMLPQDSTPAVKMMAARSLLPMGTRDLISVLFFLAADEDRAIRRAARQSLTDLPNELLRNLLADVISPKILHWFAHRGLTEELYERILLNRATADESVAYLGEILDNQRLLNIVSYNQERLLRAPEIVATLLHNRNTSLEARERVRAFIELSSGRSIDEFIRLAQPTEAAAEPEEEAAAPPEGAEARPLEAVPPEGVAEEGAPEEYEALPDDELPPDFTIEKLIREVFESEDNFSQEFLVDPDEELSSNRRVSLTNRIHKMRVLDKMRLALKGNIEARQILIKNANKMIQECVLRNPRTTIEEVIRFAKDKTMREELIRVVTLHKEWTKNYEVVHQLCWNPKTPITTALKLLNRLNIKDVIAISKSKQVPGMLAVTARKIAEAKQKFR